MLTFVCQPCRDGDHCGQTTGPRDTWCDCQHRTDLTPPTRRKRPRR